MYAHQCLLGICAHGATPAGTLLAAVSEQLAGIVS